MTAPTFIQDVNGLDLWDIYENCPAIFGDKAHESRSRRYKVIQTSKILNAMLEEGFVPTTAMQAGCRTEGNENYAKHLLRLRKREDLGKNWNKPDTRDVILESDHKGGSAYKLYSGVYRLACSNGLVVWRKDTSLVVPHKGDIVNNVVEGSLRILKESEKVMETVEEMKATKLSRPEQLFLAKQAMSLRFKQSKKERELNPLPYHPSDFLLVRHVEDAAPTVYNTMNVVQENMTKKGISREDKNGRLRSVQEIGGIAQTVDYNRNLWRLFETFMAEKKAHGYN